MTVEQKYKRIQYELANARADMGVKLKELLPRLGVCEESFRRVVYGAGGSNVLTVMRVAEGFGYELVLRRAEE